MIAGRRSIIPLKTRRVLVVAVAGPEDHPSEALEGERRGVAHRTDLPGATPPTRAAPYLRTSFLCRVSPRSLRAQHLRGPPPSDRPRRRCGREVGEQQHRTHAHDRHHYRNGLGHEPEASASTRHPQRADDAERDAKQDGGDGQHGRLGTTVLTCRREPENAHGELAPAPSHRDDERGEGDRGEGGRDQREQHREFGHSPALRRLFGTGKGSTRLGNRSRTSASVRVRSAVRDGDPEDCGLRVPGSMLFIPPGVTTAPWPTLGSASSVTMATPTTSRTVAGVSPSGRTCTRSPISRRHDDA